jgi:glutathione gamma-glutamylcysteinyltransferase
MQSEPAFCGLGSLSMVLNALEIDPKRKWRGVWRWYSDDMLECCLPLEKVKEVGMTFQQLAATARGNGLHVIAKQAHQTTYQEFLADLDQVTKSKDLHMVVSFSRSSLHQTGDGHFSPIGAYSPIENQVLVMDTARFKYPSYFVDSKQLYDAMLPLDQSTMLPRGYMLLSKGESKPLPLCRIKAQQLEWSELTNLFWSKIPEQLNAKASVEEILRVIVTTIPHKHHFFTTFETQGYDLAGTSENSRQLNQELSEELRKLLKQTSQHPVYAIVSKLPISCLGCENEIRLIVPDTIYALATLFILSIPRDLLVKLPTETCRTLLELREDATFEGLDLLKEEVSRMSLQWGMMLNSYCLCGLSECTKNKKLNA